MSPDSPPKPPDVPADPEHTPLADGTRRLLVGLDPPTPEPATQAALARWLLACQRPVGRVEPTASGYRAVQANGVALHLGGAPLFFRYEASAYETLLHCVLYTIFPSRMKTQPPSPAPAGVRRHPFTFEPPAGETVGTVAALFGVAPARRAYLQQVLAELLGAPEADLLAVLRELGQQPLTDAEWQAALFEIGGYSHSTGVLTAAGEPEPESEPDEITVHDPLTGSAVRGLVLNRSNNHEDEEPLVELATAQAAKQLGFDRPTVYFFRALADVHHEGQADALGFLKDGVANWNEMDFDGTVYWSRPSQDQLQAWLRRAHGLEIQLVRSVQPGHEGYAGCVYDATRREAPHRADGGFVSMAALFQFQLPAYEDARELGLAFALDYLLAGRTYPQSWKR